MIGLGIMGSAMSANLIAAGYPVIGYDVLAKRRQDHRRAGGRVARRCGDVGRQAQIVVCSLPSSDALCATAEELAATARPPLVVIETSTLPIAVKQAARRTLAARGVILLDCPLSGTGSQARNRDLVVYASGDRRAYRRVAPVLDAFARAHYHVGAFGAGSKMKFVANLLVAVHNGRGRGARAGDEMWPRSRDDAQGDSRRAGSSPHARGARADDGQGRLCRRADEARDLAEGHEII